MTPPSAFGTFRVLHQIGSGVLGPVFRAYDSERERLVAVKAFRLDLVPEDAARLADELRALVTQPPADPAIVGSVDAGLAGNTPFIAFDYAAGDTLDVVLREAGKPSTSQALDVCRSMARAIDASWAQGIGHGALHPRDIFVAAADQVRVSGFGISQVLERVGVKAPIRRPYGAPERVAGGEWDVRADVYALAAVARDLWTDAGGEVPGPVRAVLDRALDESPDARFAAASDLVHALEQAASAALAESPGATPASGLGTRPPRARGRERVERARPLDETVLPAPALDVDIPRHEPAYALLSSVAADRPRFPWVAAAAMAIAGVAVGAVLGYQFGFSRGSDRAIARAVAEAVAEPPPAVIETPTPPAARRSRTLTAQVPPGASLPTAATGAIDFDTVPRGARVSVDGTYRGETPVRVPGLSPGDHRVQLELSGHRRVTSTVVVHAGGTTPHKIRLEQVSVSQIDNRTGSRR